MSFVRSVRFWIGMFVSLLFLWLALRNIPFQSFSGSVASANYLWLVPAVTAQLLAVVARSLRWTVLLKQPKKLASSFWAQGIGYLFTNLLPLRMGEPARILVMAEQCNLPVMFVTGTAVVERLLDVATIVLTLAFVLPWMQVPESVSNAGLTFGALVLIGLVVIALMARFKQAAHRLMEAVLKFFRLLPVQSLLHWWDDLIDSFAILLDWRVALKAVVWSVITWSLSAIVYWSVIRAFQPDGLIIEAVFMMVTLSLAVTVPSSPGFIGIFQFAGQQALVLPFEAKYNSANALAITLSAHLVYYTLTTILGLIAIWVTGTSFAQLTRKLFGQKANPSKTESAL